MEGNIIKNHIRELKDSNYDSSLDIEERIYKLLLSSRKLFHKKQSRIEFHQFWQQNQAFGDYEAVKRLLAGTPLLKEVEFSNEALIILPKMGKAIVMNFRTILKSHYVRRDKGWVEYSEQSI